jgi:hypothetical protein
MIAGTLTHRESLSEWTVAAARDVLSGAGADFAVWRSPGRLVVALNSFLVVQTFGVLLPS